MTTHRDHGGGIDAAIAQYGGKRAGWLDLSTGINPVPYPMPKLSHDAWTALPDKGAFDLIIARARQFWNVPGAAAILPVPGLSSVIAQLPRMMPKGDVQITTPTYNEHAAAFQAAGWTISQGRLDAMVAVHPNNPDGRMWEAEDLSAPLCIIDESFCDVIPDASHMALTTRPGTVVLKSFGKFWGLAGLRLGFAIGDPAITAKLSDALGPWQVSGPALQIGAEALGDFQWAVESRMRLRADAARLDALMTDKGAVPLGGTDLFRLFEVADAQAAQDHLAASHVWSRVFPYASNWLRLGLPPPDRWAQLEAAF